MGGVKFMDILEQELYHHGIMGQKWGIRRFQNSDGSLTEAGRRRYLKQSYKQDKKNIEKARRETIQSGYNERRSMIEAKKAVEKAEKIRKRRDLKDKERNEVDMKLSIATQMASDYKRNKDEYYKMVNDAKMKYGDKKIKDIRTKMYNQGNSKKEYVDGNIPVSASYLGLGLGAIAATSAILGASSAIPAALFLLNSDDGFKNANYSKKRAEYLNEWKNNSDNVIRANLGKYAKD